MLLWLVLGMKEDLIWNQFGLLTTDWIPSRFFFLFPSPRSSYYLPSSSKGKNHWEWRMIFHLLPFVWQSHLYFSCNTDSSTSIFVLEKRGKKFCFRAGSNRGPCACEAHVITTTLRKLRCSVQLLSHDLLVTQNVSFCNNVPQIPFQTLQKVKVARDLATTLTT